MKKNVKGQTIYSEPIFLGKPITGSGRLRVWIPKFRKKKKVIWCEMPVLVIGWMWRGKIVDMTHQSLH